VIPFAAVATGKFRRYLDPQTAVDAVRVPIGVAQAWRQVRAFSPDVVFSTGGFVSVPTVIAAARIAPILTHEQTTAIGLATKINARFADALALSYEQTRDRVGGVKLRITVTGNPVRLTLLDGIAARAYERFGFDPGVPLLYVTGGARGSTPINQQIEALLPELLDHCQILHQVGPPSANDDLARLTALRSTWTSDRQRRYQVVDFIGDELKDVYAAALFVFGRAGAGTIAELSLVGKPSILIPLPLSGGGEQDTNARVLGDVGAAMVINQDDATPARLWTEILALFANPDRLAQISAKAKSLARPDAAHCLADELLRLASR
jgi:UDP-N-acetylglucosamine--N-acetylmuramyl-(pentapeptide) pyrophosphoryl-undecaprenol N-acetylglucosamine transferase